MSNMHKKKKKTGKKNIGFDYQSPQQVSQCLLQTLFVLHKITELTRGLNKFYNIQHSNSSLLTLDVDWRSCTK